MYQPPNATCRARALNGATSPSRVYENLVKANKNIPSESCRSNPPNGFKELHGAQKGRLGSYVRLYRAVKRDT